MATKISVLKEKCEQRNAEIKQLLAFISEKCDALANADNMDWGHVGNLCHVQKDLTDISTFLGA